MMAQAKAFAGLDLILESLSCQVSSEYFYNSRVAEAVKGGGSTFCN